MLLLLSLRILRTNFFGATGWEFRPTFKLCSLVLVLVYLQFQGVSPTALLPLFFPLEEAAEAPLGNFTWNSYSIYNRFTSPFFLFGLADSMVPYLWTYSQVVKLCSLVYPGPIVYLAEEEDSSPPVWSAGSTFRSSRLI